MVQRGPASAFSIAESFAAVPGSTFRRTAARPSVPIGPLVTDTAVSAVGLGGGLPPKPLFVLPLGGPGAKGFLDVIKRTGAADRGAYRHILLDHLVGAGPCEASH